MGSLSGIVTVGDKPVGICAVPMAGVRIRNTGAVAVWLGGADVTAGDGYLIEPGTPSEHLSGASRVRQSPVVPAPPDDASPMIVYGCTDQGAGETKVAWIVMGTS